MRPFLRPTLLALLSVSALLLYPTALGAAPQDPVPVSPASLERIREELQKAPPLRIQPAAPVHQPPTFKSRVEHRAWVPTLKEHLHKEFDLSPMQRQSAEWASKCCGLNVGQLLKGVEDAVRARQIRKTREQIARELAFIEAALRAAPVK